MGPSLLNFLRFWSQYFGVESEYINITQKRHKFVSNPGLWGTLILILALLVKLKASS